ncbi:MAG: PEGA domain-containing protein [Acidobacteria bacterium]|nr:MAG: PEGA domain-containing protein [Acidobacteriota bacterium]REK08848.1 MAG: PEGA domain-containing protein [Acidobacteriota bacterium]
MTSSSESPPPKTAKAGSGLVFGRFVTEAVIGRGGMGVVYRARDPVIGRTVAIKALRTDTDLTDARRDELQSRFELEFQSAGTLSHPNIVTIFDVGQEDDVAFIAMEFVQGQTLDQMLRSGDTITFEEICDIADGLCAGLDFAHQSGVVHRDVKPANIMLTGQGQVKITDFGVAKVRSADLTQTGTVIGTPSYMAPEQIMGRDITGACDQFAAGAIFFHMLTGVLPFAADDPATILYRVAHEAPPRPSDLYDSLPEAVDAVLLRALSKDANSRYATCTEFARALRRALLTGEGAIPGGRGDDAPTHDMHHLDSQSGGMPQTVTLSHGPELGSSTYEGAASWWHRSSGGPKLAFVTLLLLGLAAAAWFAYQQWGVGVAAPDVAVAADRTGTEAVPEPAEPPPPATATFLVETTPGGASVEVDGEAIEGTTPLEIELVLGAPHVLTASRQGYRPESLSLTPDAESERQLVLELERIIQPGRIEVAADYPVQLRIGGRRIDPNAVSPGDHEVQLVSRDVYLDEHRPVEVRSGETSTVRLPPAVSVRLIAVVPNGRVSIDGEEPLEAPADVRLVAGSHRFEFLWPDGERTSARLRIDAGVSQVIGSPTEIIPR